MRMQDSTSTIDAPNIILIPIYMSASMTYSSVKLNIIYNVIYILILLTNKYYTKNKYKWYTIVKTTKN